MDINLENAAFIEQLFALYQEDETKIDPSWKSFFERKKEDSPTLAQAPSDLKVYNLIEAYRTYGHLLARINPIAIKQEQEPWQLNLSHLGFNESDLNQPFPTCGLLPQETAELKKIIETLKSIYCGQIGFEYMGLQNPQLERWLQEQIEPGAFRHDLTIAEKKMILQHLNKSELFEVFLHTKYTGQKRFSIEGGETLIPMLAALLELGVELETRTFVIGMAHRGRLNVLSNILQKSYGTIFSEFEEGYIPESFEGSGDVKYHKGYTSKVELKGREAQIFLAPNPSHLEAVDPVVEGQTFARQVLNGGDKNSVLPILIHGDAAIAGQGVVYETLQLSKLEGYSTGGTLHIVINNQIGFTTLPEDARSTTYCTDIARTFNAPVFHVNAEAPEACVLAVNLAVQIRKKFQCDVFIDLNCYRKYGHNETDEPAFTQPLEYQLIKKKKPIRELYRDHLVHQGVLEKDMAEALEEEFKKALHEEHEQTKLPKSKEPQPASDPNVRTAVSKEILIEVAKEMSAVPPDFNIHKKLERLVNDRQAMILEDKPIDWGMGELLAYATLLYDGKDVRLTGQDCGRGTFSHRHALWMDQVQERAYFPLKHLRQSQGRFEAINTPLSEYAPLGFEFGYSSVCPDALVIWEAQFGDFCNGAQVIIDQFITTTEQKWSQKSNLVMLLPHGYEGQGPEHSSARIERFLSLCGDENLTVVNPTKPAQLFHLLRRQALAPMNKPLIVFTPKGLLRHPECTSRVAQFVDGSFHEIIDEGSSECTTLILCSGRIYYDLLPHKQKEWAIIRLEQLYPFPKQQIQESLKQYPNIHECYWVQEEPANMGGWYFLRPQLREILPHEPTYVGRERSAATATGSFHLHKKQWQEIVDRLLKGEKQ